MTTNSIKKIAGLAVKTATRAGGIIVHENK